MIAIIDYGMGNLRSVQKAIEHVGGEASITNNLKEIGKAQAIVLPGVGAFGEAMRRLNELKLIDPLRHLFNPMTGIPAKPFLGICLGFQLLYESSEEDPKVEGLGVFNGVVKKFSGKPFKSGLLKVPHMGWNTLLKKTSQPWLKDLQAEDRFYFVHSYYVAPKQKSNIALTCHYGIDFCAAVGGDNYLASQFHPEKSGEVGLRLLKNFVQEIR